MGSLKINLYLSTGLLQQSRQCCLRALPLNPLSLDLLLQSIINIFNHFEYFRLCLLPDLSLDAHVIVQPIKIIFNLFCRLCR